MYIFKKTQHKSTFKHVFSPSHSKLALLYTGGNGSLVGSSSKFGVT